MSKAKSLTDEQLAVVRSAPPSAFQWNENIQQYKPKPRDIHAEEMEKYYDESNQSS